jgi:cytochrome c oxidase subunit III
MEAHEDNKGARLGMWLFLYTEVMLFGGLFVLYAAYYYRYSPDFAAAGKETDIVLGTLNTVILLTSSFTVASAIAAMKRGSKKVVIILLSVTILLALAFLFNKYMEWSHKFETGLYPGSSRLANEMGITIFFGLYFTLTGLHAIHVSIGIIVLSTCLTLSATERITAQKINILENSGLYWHLVDIIWIFLFPLFYLLL